MNGNSEMSRLERALRRAPKDVVVGWLLKELNLQAIIRPSVYRLEAAVDDHELEVLKARIQTLEAEIEDAVAASNFGMAAVLRDKCERLRRREDRMWKRYIDAIKAPSAL